MKTDKTIRISKTKYRELAETVKRYGMGLELMSCSKEQFKGKLVWGLYSPWAMLVCNNAADPESKWSERALVSLSPVIKAGELRHCGRTRPELDWSALEDHELADFVIWHEIGHRQDNFDAWMTGLNEPNLFRESQGKIKYINEVLADRYAWEKMRPGEPVPLTESGKAKQEFIEETISFFASRIKKNRPADPARALEPGQYRDVPARMLRTPELAAYVGTRIAPEVISRCEKIH